MKQLKLVLFLILICNGILYSQKIIPPKDITFDDFKSAINNSKNLYFNSVITFPYSEDRYEAGAIDKLFSLKSDNFSRCVYNYKDSVLILPKINFKSKLEIKSIKYYYVDKNKLSTRTVKKSELKFSQTENEYILNLNIIKRDSNFIVDLRYVFETKDKTILNLEFEKVKTFVEAKVEIFIPEIYTYAMDYNDSIFTYTIQKEYMGPKIGARSISDANNILTSSGWIELRKKNNPNISFVDVFCNLNQHIFSLKKNNQIYTHNNLNINFKLISIHEIKD